MGTKQHFIGIATDGILVDLFGGKVSVQTSEPTGAIARCRAGQQERLAEPESAESDLYKLAQKHGLDPVFSEDVEKEVARLVEDPGLDDDSLVDMSDAPFVTIDGADSMDLDQAAYVENVDDGHVVHYALANASHYVRSGTALHAEALRRGASYYLPGIMVPMLPRALSEGLVSLNADVPRRALVFSMTLDSEGVCTQTVVQTALIRSRAKLSFGSVQTYYDGGPGFGDAIDQSLDALAVVGKKRMQLAEERGVVRYRRHEVVAKLDKKGVRFTATTGVRRAVERYNEQLSLLCNIEGARYLAQRERDFVEPIYRVHPAPSPRKMQAFVGMLRTLVKSRKLDRSIWYWDEDSKTTLRDYLDALPSEGADGRIASAIHRQAVMANVRSVFQTEAAGHHGVGAEVYARFSAPMREMVGVFLHHELLEAKEGTGVSDPELRARIVEMANAAKSLQRKVSNEGNRLVLDQLFEDAQQTDAVRPGTLMGAQRNKAYVRLDDPPIDVKVYLRGSPSNLKPSRDDAALMRDGQVIFQLGDAVGVKVTKFDEDAGRWVLELVPV